MKQLVNEFHALDIKELARKGYLYPFSKYDWVWRTNKGTEQTTVTVTVLEDALQLSYILGTIRILQSVRLAYSIGPHGGKRPWFLCPTCPKRVGILYYAAGQPFRCRLCCNLAYPSQYQSKDQSYGRQIRALTHRDRNRLSALCGVGS